MNEIVIPLRKKFFFNKFKKSSHIILKLFNYSGVLPGKIKADVISERISKEYEAEVDASGNVSFVYRYGQRKFNFYGSGVEGMDGLYTEDDNSENSYSSKNNKIYYDVNKKRWYASVGEANKFESDTDELGLIPPRKFSTSLIESEYTPEISWLAEELEAVPPISIQLKNNDGTPIGKLQEQVYFTFDDYECNDKDCSNDKITYEKREGKSNVLDFFNVKTPDYSLMIKEKKSETVIAPEKIVNYTQRIIGSDIISPPEKIEYSYGMNDNMDDGIFGSSLHDKYIAVISKKEADVKEQGASESFEYFLYEAVENEKRYLTFSWLEEINDITSGNTFSHGDMNDSSYLIIFNEKKSWYDIVEIRNYDNYSSSVVTGCEECFQYISGIIIDGMGAQYNAKPEDETYLSKVMNKIDISGGKSIEFCRFIAFYKKPSETYNDFNIRFEEYYGHQHFFNEGNPHFNKGRIISYASAVQYNSEIVFKKNEREIVKLKIIGNPILNFKSAEIVLKDDSFSFFSNDTGNIISFNNDTTIDGSINGEIEGGEILSYLNIGLPEKSSYINDDFVIKAVCYDEFGDFSFPYLKSSEISYFEKGISMEFQKYWGDRKKPVYIKNSDSDVIVSFSANYGKDENENPIKVNNHRISFDSIECSYNDFSTGEPPKFSEEEPFSDYPFRWKGLQFGDFSPDNNIRINYDSEKNWYSIRIPYGKLELEREKIILPEEMKFTFMDERISIGGKDNPYVLMKYSEVNKEAGTEYDSTDYIGYNRVYKMILKTGEKAEKKFYLRGLKKQGEKRWVVSDNIKAEKWISYSEGRGDDYGDYPHKAFEKFYYQNSSYSDSFYSTGSRQSGSCEKINADSENGKEHRLYIRLVDSYGNMTLVSMRILKIHQFSPSELSLALIGSSGNNNYTGFYKKSDRFMLSDFIETRFSAFSEIGIRYCFSGDGIFFKGGEWKDIKSTEIKKSVIRIKPVNSENSLFQADNTVDVTFEVIDEAGNRSSLKKSIKYISYLFRTKYQHLIKENSDYSHKVYSFDNNSLLSIPEKTISETEYVRSWNEIWFPETHGVPLLDNGEINVEEAIRISKDGDETGKNGPTDEERSRYDALSLKKQDDVFVLETDSEGRYIQDMKKWNTNKTYRGFTNNRIVNQSYEKYWIIDNTGNTELQLEFEVFDFNKNVTTIPANFIAPYDGDMVSVYDATDNECVSSYIDKYGKKKYSLKDTSKLKHLFTLKGSYLDTVNNPFTMIDSNVSGELVSTGNGFITPMITECNRLCIVPFTDYGDSPDSVASGFKLKAGPRHMVEYLNYDKIDDTGEFWVHKSPESKNGSWDSPSSLKMYYKYYGSFSHTDYDKAVVQFEGRMNSPVVGTFVNYSYLDTNGDCRYPYERFTCYDYKIKNIQENSPGIISKCSLPDPNTENSLKSFALTEDDILDYTDPGFYVVPDGERPRSEVIYDYPTSASDSKPYSEGRLASKYTIVKDTGILTFTGFTPLGRIFGNYYHHTFYRLTSDGYGDLFFYGTGIVVPAKETKQYSDWAYVDLKIVNEGTNSLRSGTLQFLARGYITKGTVVDTVLNQNRPWDIQQGTTAETVQRTGAVYSTSYSDLVEGPNSEATRKNAFSARGKQACVFGDLAPKSCVYVRVFWCIANDANGESWIDCTRGAKCFSAELSGSYYIFTAGN